jgi:hypothetical protein
MHIPRDCVAAAKDVLFTKIGHKMVELNNIVNTPPFCPKPITVVVPSSETCGSKKQKLEAAIPMHLVIILN